jgi:hypothetical protein
VTIQTLVTTSSILIILKNELHYLKAQRMGFHVVYWMASFDEVGGSYALLNFDLWYLKVLIEYFVDNTGHSPISCEGFNLGSAWDSEIGAFM